MTEPIRELDCVVLLRDVPGDGLRAGDVGTVVYVNAPDSFEVEFVAPSGHTLALLTLSSDEVRIASRDDLETRPRGGG